MTVSLTLSFQSIRRIIKQETQHITYPVVLGVHITQGDKYADLIFYGLSWSYYSGKECDVYWKLPRGDRAGFGKDQISE